MNITTTCHDASADILSRGAFVLHVGLYIFFFILFSTARHNSERYWRLSFSSALIMTAIVLLLTVGALVMTVCNSAMLMVSRVTTTVCFLAADTYFLACIWAQRRLSRDDRARYLSLLYGLNYVSLRDRFDALELNAFPFEELAWYVACQGGDANKHAQHFIDALFTDLATEPLALREQLLLRELRQNVLVKDVAFEEFQRVVTIHGEEP